MAKSVILLITHIYAKVSDKIPLCKLILQKCTGWGMILW
ncbi:hypothetical protein SPBRAN_40 [uncultured Candidatus Thioglobus sp.]|nr:hypothetical protein SPBRAN_40 [uncultured Candidatus Thioglobus sp.]